MIESEDLFFRSLIEEIPPFATKDTINSVMIDIMKFLTRSHTFKGSIARLTRTKFSLISKMSKEEEAYFNQQYSKNRNSLFLYIKQFPSHSLFIHDKLGFNRIVSLFSPNYINELERLAIYSSSMKLFIYCLKNASPNAKPSMISNDYLYDSLQSVYKRSYLVFEWTQLSKTIDFKNSSDLYSTTSFAANEKYLAFCDKNGMLYFRTHTEPLYEGTIQIPTEKHQNISLAFIKNDLYVFGSKNVLIIDIIQSKIISKLPSPYKKPIVSDGYLFYCIHYKHGKIDIFEDKNGLFLHKTIKLSLAKGMQITSSTPIVTNGRFISFIVQNKDQSLIYVYSLNTCSLVHKHDLPMIPIVSSWALTSVSGMSFILARDVVHVLNSFSDVSPRALGISLEYSPKFSNVFSLLENEVINGSNIFDGSDEESLISMIEIARNADEKTQRSILVILFNQKFISQTCLSSLQQLICSEQKYNIQKLVCSAFLSWLQNTKDFAKVQTPNPINTSFEKFENIELTTVFYHLFDFRKIKLSSKAVLNMMISIIRTPDWDHTILFIVRAFFKNYLHKRITKAGFSAFLPILKMIIEKIVFILLRDGAYKKQSYALVLWKDLIRAFYNKSQQGNQNSTEISCLIISLFQQLRTVQSIKDQKFEKLILRTYFILLSTIFSTPHRRGKPVFESLQDFYEKYPNQLNDYDSFVDQNLFKIMNYAYDVSNESDFAQFFFEIRKFLLFECTGGKKRLLIRLDKKAYTLNAIKNLITKGNGSELMNVPEQNYIQSFLSGAPLDFFSIKLDIIFFAFSRQIEERIYDFIQCDIQSLKKFITSIKYMHLLPPEILKRIGVSLDSNTLLELPTNLLLEFIKKSLDSIPKLSKSHLLYSGFLQPVLSFEKDLSTVHEENNLFRISILWYIAISQYGYEVYEKTVTAVAQYVFYGSFRIIEMIFKGLMIVIKHLQLDISTFDLLLKSVYHFIVNGKNPFLCQTNPREIQKSVFLLIGFLKYCISENIALLNYLVEKVNSSQIYFIISTILLNNVFETIREGAIINILTRNGESIEGIVESYYLDSNSISVSSFNAVIKLSVSQCNRIWCYPANKISLINVKDFSIFIKWFLAEISNVRAKVFQYASLLLFCEDSRFLQCLSKDFFKKYVLTEIPPQFSPQNVVYEFISMLYPHESVYSHFQFYSPSDICINSSSIIAQNFLIKKDESSNGSIITTHLSEGYISTPIYPFIDSSTNLKISGINDKYKKPSLTFRVVSFSNLFGTKLESIPIIIYGDVDTPKYIRIIIKNRECSIFTDSNLQSCYKINPSTTYIYFVADVGPSTVVDYSFSEEINGFNQGTDGVSISENDPIMIQNSNASLPYIESSHFIGNQMKSYASLIIQSLQILITSTISTSQISLLSSLSLLSIIHNDLYDYQFFISKLRNTNTWMDSSEKLKSFLIRNKSVYSWQEIEQFINKMDSPSKYYYNPMNRSALLINSNSKVSLQNCYVISAHSSVPLKVLSAFSCFLQISHLSVVIPIRNIEHSAISTILDIRHLISLVVSYAPEYFSNTLHKIIEISPPDSFSGLLINRFIEMASIIYPSYIDFCSLHNLCNMESFLVKSSVVHTDPKKYLLPHLLLLSQKNRFQGSIPYHVKVELPTPFIIAIYSDNQNEKFEIDLKDTKIIVNSGEIIELSVLSFSVRPYSSLCNLEVLHYYISNIHDYKNVGSEILEWNPSDSYQLLFFFPFNTKISPDLYSTLPISSMFSIETASFIHHILKNNQNSVNITYSYHIPPPIQIIRGSLIEEEFPYSTHQLKEIAYDYSVKPYKYDFLRKNHCPLNFVSDPYYLRLKYLPPQRFDSFGNRRYKPLLTLDTNTLVYSRLCDFLTQANNYILLLFINYCTGVWGTKNITSGQKIAILYDKSPNTINAYRNEGIIQIGEFENKDKFFRALLSVLQQHDSQLFK